MYLPKPSSQIDAQESMVAKPSIRQRREQKLILACHSNPEPATADNTK